MELETNTSCKLQEFLKSGFEFAPAVTVTDEKFREEIRQFVLQKNYPCIAAIKSVNADEFLIGHYEDFGSGKNWRDLRKDLENFIQAQEKTNSTYLTFWAIYSGKNQFTEQEFENRLWNELSHLSSSEQREKDWANVKTSDPQDPGFCLSLNGKAFFVVGLHPQSSRLGRKFSSPALVFNVIEQFENLERQGQYEPMKTLNRKRDILFQGDVNPMVEKHGDKWESIQFSGQTNPDSWKCPFHFMSEKDKP